MSTLQQSKLRIHWARKKLEDLKSAIETAWKNADEAAAKQSYPNARDPYFLFRDNLSDETVRLVSEFVLHARAALDYIIYRLAWTSQKNECWRSGQISPRTQGTHTKEPREVA